MKAPLVPALLILLVLSLSGVCVAAAAAFHPKGTDACCAPAHGTEEADLPCAAPDCPCLYCLSLDLNRPVTVVFHASPLLRTLPLLASSLPHPFVRAIDYPPEIS